MNKHKILKVILTLIVSITIITYVAIVIMFLKGDYSLELLYENTFFVLSALACILILPRLERYYAIKFTVSIKVQLYLFIFGLIIVGNVYDVLYHTIWFDKILHFLSGSFLASIGILFVNKWTPFASKRIKGYIAFLYSASITLLWEIFEFLLDILLSILYPTYEYTMQFFHLEKEIWILPQPYTLVDTMFDVIFGVLGAIVFVTIYIHTQKDTDEQKE